MFALLKHSQITITVQIVILIVKSVLEEIRIIIAHNVKVQDIYSKTNASQVALIISIKIRLFRLVNLAILDAQSVLNQLI